MNIESRLLVFSLLVFLLRESAAKSMKPGGRGECSECPPGWGVAKRCTQHRDTLCEKCQDGETYSTQHSPTGPCWLCSRCGVGLYEAETCSPRRDTVCDECTSFIGQKNFHRKNDFSHKCSYLFLRKLFHA